MRSLPAFALAAGALLTAAPAAAQPGGESASSAPSIVFTRIAAGSSFSCGLDADGAAWCWGANLAGQLGRDTSTHVCSDERWESGPCSPRPVRVAGDRRYSAIDAGEFHACAIDTDGAAWCWGSNEWNQLGVERGGEECRISWRRAPWLRPIDCSREPRMVPSTVRFTQIIAGDEASCALDDAGGAWCWGGKSYEKAPPLRVPIAARLVSLAGSGPEHVCGLTAEGAAICWSSRSQIESPRSHAQGLRFSRIAAGPFHDCAIDVEGRAHCWGGNGDGQIGAGFADDRTLPATGVPGGRFRDIATSDERTCAIDTSDGLHCWGRVTEVWQRNLCKHRAMSIDAGGEPDFSTYPRGCTTRPRRMAVSGVEMIAMGPTHRCAIFRDGPTRCWGTNAWGELGDGTTVASDHPTPVMGPPPPRWRTLAAEARALAAELLVRCGAAIAVLALVFAHSRPAIAARDRRGVARLWWIAAAVTVSMWLAFRVIRDTVFAGTIEPLVMQPLIVALVVSAYWLWTRARGHERRPVPAAVQAPAPLEDPVRARTARRLGAAALIAVIAGWIPVVRLAFSEAPFGTASGELALAAATATMVLLLVSVTAGSIVGVALAVAARRSRRQETLARVALGIGSTVLGGVGLLMMWIAYFV